MILIELKRHPACDVCMSADLFQRDDGDIVEESAGMAPLRQFVDEDVDTRAELLVANVFEDIHDSMFSEFLPIGQSRFQGPVGEQVQAVPRVQVNSVLIVLSRNGTLEAWPRRH